MFNPFVRFIPELVEAFLRHGEHLLVSQTFRAGMDMTTEEMRVLMLSQYNDLGFAQIHLQALHDDPLAAIIDLNREKHRNKVMELLQPGSGYLVYSCLIRDRHSVENFADRYYANKLRTYIDRNTSWKISNGVHVRPKLQLIFGELFILLKYQNQQLRIRFEEIEKL